MAQGFSSLFGQKLKQEVTALSGTGNTIQNIWTHKATALPSSSDVRIQVTHHGSYWGSWHGDPKKDCALLCLSFKLVQHPQAILKDCRITLSFDCHPDEGSCHRPESAYLCQKPNPQDQKARGIVQTTSPGELRGGTIKSNIKHHHQYTFAPNMNVASFGTFSLGSMEWGQESTNDQLESWVLNSHVFPPSKHHGFSSRTDACFDWQHNQAKRGDYPTEEIPIGLVVEYHRTRNSSVKDGPHLPVRLAIDGSLSRWSYFAKFKTRDFVFPVFQELKEESAGLNSLLARTFYESHPVTPVHVAVECSRSILGDCTIKIVGDCDYFLSWEPERALSMEKKSDDGNTTVWELDTLLKVKVERFEYKFIKVWPEKDKRYAWEESRHNRQWSSSCGRSILSSPVWQDAKELNTFD